MVILWVKRSVNQSQKSHIGNGSTEITVGFVKIAIIVINARQTENSLKIICLKKIKGRH